MPTFLDPIWSNGKKIAVIDSSGNAFSFDDLSRMIIDFSLEPNEGTAVALMTCSNTVEAIAGYLAFVKGQFATILLPTNIRTIDNYVSLYTPKYLYLDHTLDHCNYREVFRFGKYHLYILRSPVNSGCEINSELRLLLTTSGSTGSPKLVRISDENIELNCKMILQSLRINNDDIAITTLPFSYSYGLSIINTSLLNGNKIQLNEYSIIQRSFWDLLLSSRATNFGGIPFNYQQLEQIGLDRLKSSHIRFMTQAGGRLPRSTFENVFDFCEHNNIDFFVMYGQTEATARMSVLSPLDAKRFPSSVGKAISPGRFELINPEISLEVNGFKVGELVFTGGSVALGYASSKEDLRLGDTWKGVLRTGDLAYFNKEGFVHIVGRINRFAKIRGVRYSLEDIEEIFASLEIDVVALEFRDQIILVSTKDVASTTIEKALYLIDGLRLSDVKTIKISELPRTPAGKLDFRTIESIVSSASIPE